MSILPISSHVIAIVPIRSGSKGLPGKNIMPINGIPLYMHAVHQGLRTVGQVVLSTDISEIDGGDLPNGCILCHRPAPLAADDTPMQAVIKHLIADCLPSGKTIMLLQATSPLRLDSDIIAALELFETHQYDMVMSVVERDSGVLKYGTIDETIFTAMRDHDYCFSNRQKLPKVYGPNGAVYIFKADKFIEENGFPSSKIGVIKMPLERSADIDTLPDLLNVEKVMQKRVATHDELPEN